MCIVWLTIFFSNNLQFNFYNNYLRFNFYVSKSHDNPYYLGRGQKKNLSIVTCCLLQGWQQSTIARNDQLPRHTHVSPTCLGLDRLVWTWGWLLISLLDCGKQASYYFVQGFGKWVNNWLIFSCGKYFLKINKPNFLLDYYI